MNTLIANAIFGYAYIMILLAYIVAAGILGILIQFIVYQLTGYSIYNNLLK